MYRVTLVRTQRDAVQMGLAEVYRVTLVRTHRGMLYRWSRQKCTGYIGTHTQSGAVQMEQAEVYRVSAWTREAKNGKGADKAHGEELCVFSRLFLVFQTGQG